MGIRIPELIANAGPRRLGRLEIWTSVMDSSLSDRGYINWVMHHGGVRGWDEDIAFTFNLGPDTTEPGLTAPRDIHSAPTLHFMESAAPRVQAEVCTGCEYHDEHITRSRRI